VKRIFYIVTVIILLVIINNLSRSIYDLWHKKDILTDAQKRLEIEKQKNIKLKAELSYVQSEAFIEEQARNKLFMSKPGEQDVLIPKNLLETGKNKNNNPEKQNWQKWLDLFIK
jgi:cell division protein FtsB